MNDDDENKKMFWALKPQCAEVGISPSLMGKLAATCGDYPKAIEALQQAIAATDPPSYLGAIIRDLLDAPKIVSLARINRVPVERIRLADGTHGWRIGDAVYNRHGVDVGA